MTGHQITPTPLFTLCAPEDSLAACKVFTQSSRSLTVVNIRDLHLSDAFAWERLHQIAFGDFIPHNRIASSLDCSQ